MSGRFAVAAPLRGDTVMAGPVGAGAFVRFGVIAGWDREQAGVGVRS